ncbi:CynX/NimT family MFS transporter [Priestia koreensis]|uniref:CynX/NimT family MFS transporter n=1 Tax=Priestia koreensis TaxID=284581 RepID=UPI0009FA480D|nr:MFS transporter [Priestia koreensis]
MSAERKLDEQLYTEAERKIAPKAGTWLLILGIIFIAMNLRAPITSVGPLVGLIRDNLHISNTLAGTITTVPLLAFALVSPFAPRLAKRFGMEAVLFVSLLVLTVGVILRSLSGTLTLFVGTVMLGLAIAIGNVLLPSIIKKEFPHKIGLMTGVYSVAMNLCAAVASGLSVPLASNLGWGWIGALGYWVVISFVSILVWMPQMRKRVKPQIVKKSVKSEGNLLRSGLAWQVTFFMGLQSLIFYTIVAWLPEILIEQGLSSSAAGWTLSLLQFAVLPVTFLIPVFAGKMKSQSGLAAASGGLFVIAILGLLYGSTSLTVLWVILLGVAGGSAFSLSMMFFGMRTTTAGEAASLSGMAQSIGYLLAAVGPTLFGLLHDTTHSWTAPLYMLVVASALILLCGIGAGRNKTIES